MINMSWMRRPIFRRLVAATFLLTGLLTQMQAVYACDLMNSRPSTACCCSTEMADGCALGGGCAQSPAPASPGCCDITLEAPPSLNAAPVAPSHAVALPDAHQPAPALPSYYSHELTSLQKPHTAVHCDGPPTWLAGTDTYLITLRLRI